MNKPPATAALIKRKSHLADMAERGTEHERKIASEKIKRLDAKFDFSASPHQEPDIFAGWPKPKSSANAFPVLVVPKEWLDAANLIKWMFQDQFSTASLWSNGPTETKLMLHCSLADTKKFKPFAKSMLDTIIAACREYSGATHVRQLDRAAFLTGIYDGLINERHPSGKKIPGFSADAKKKPAKGHRKKKSRAASTSAATVHPYDLGHSAGHQMRFKVPRDQICKGIQLAVTGPQEGPEDEHSE